MNDPERADAIGESPRPITAVALDRRIDWSRLTTPSDWRELRRYPYGRSYALRDEATLFVFGFGAVVCDGRATIQEFGREVEACTGAVMLEPTKETYFISVDSSATESGMRVGWDRVVIAERRPELVAAVALSLAQSVALERYEVAVDSVLDRTLELSARLAKSGRLRFSTRGLIERVGRLNADRLELARWFYLIDRPEETWENPRVAQLHDALFANLELRQRHDAMQHKLSTAERATQSALELWHGRRSNALEWAIVWLIVVEIVLGVWDRI
ncbi:MAG: RMD1 family protein [Planctomycetes bacterium]|nr:RMD1 family protein [Planctomycetota bacterium]